jgi:hypothetical protein
MITILVWLGLNWVIPMVLCWVYEIYGRLSGDFVHMGFYGPFAKYRLSYKMHKWHDRLWRDWGGVGLFLFMVYRDEIGPEDDAYVARTVVHEGTHCWQWMWLGGMFYVSYLAHMAFIYFFQKDKHPYLDCWAERMARKASGQLVDIPPDQWPQGPKDRNPWW